MKKKGTDQRYFIHARAFDDLREAFNQGAPGVRPTGRNRDTHCEAGLIRRVASRAFSLMTV